MLQQTRVDAVRRVYPGFLARYPTPQALAEADDDELLSAWSGLGYYRRARFLRAGARAVVERHAGRIPEDPDQLARLPGVGPYTTGAIASIAFDRPEPAIDGNVERVVARHRGVDGDVKRAGTARRIRAIVQQWHEAARRPADLTQALMELGALVCTPRAPSCDECPVADDCVARQEERQHHLPRLPRPRRSRAVTARAVLVSGEPGLVLAARVPAGEVNAGQAELPGAGLLHDVPDASDLPAALARRHGLRVEIGEPLAEIRHAITHHCIRLTVHAARLLAPAPEELFFASPQDPAIPWSTASRKALRIAQR